MEYVTGLEAYVGAPVQDGATGFTGVLVDVIPGFVDPRRAAPPQDTAFIRPFGGGVERAVHPADVRLLEAPGQRPCAHPGTARRDGKTYCATCGYQLYL